MGDDEGGKKGPDKRVLWLKSKAELSFGKKADAKFAKTFLADESVVKVRCSLQRWGEVCE